MTTNFQNDPLFAPSTKVYGFIRDNFAGRTATMREIVDGTNLPINEAHESLTKLSSIGVVSSQSGVQSQPDPASRWSLNNAATKEVTDLLDSAYDKSTATA